MADSTKEHVSIVICGHVDAGKSTTTGRLIFELGGIDKRDMDKLKEEAKVLGKESFAFAFYMDRNKDERARGVTIACTTKEFYTEKYHYSVIDAPGHRDFIKNMISGASQADVALLMVPADGNFTTAIQKGNHKKGVIQGQSRQHARLINLIGVTQVAVGVNKMDADTAEYKESRFIEIRDEVTNFLSKIGYGGKGKGPEKQKRISETIPIIPMSGWKGDNLLKKSDNMKWWKGVEVTKMDGKKTTIVTLVDMLNDFVCLPERDSKSVMRMPVNGVFKIKGVGDVITGRVEQGVVKPGMEVVFPPRHTASRKCTGKVFTVEMHHKNVPAAHPGDNVGLNMKGLDKSYLPEVGNLMCEVGSILNPCETFTAQVQVLQIPDKNSVGYQPVGFVRTARAPCTIKKIVWRKGKKTGGKKVDDAGSCKAVYSNEAAEIEFAPTQPMCVTAFKECPGLGRIAFLEGHQLCMMGKIKSIAGVFKEKKKKTDGK